MGDERFDIDVGYRDPLDPRDDFPEDKPSPAEYCNCAERCGDDGDVDGPGTCKGLPLPRTAPLIEIVLVPRGDVG